MSKASYDEWEEIIAKRAFILREDLSSSEKDIMRISFDIFVSRLEDMSYLSEEVKRLTKENNKLKDFNRDLIDESKNKN